MITRQKQEYMVRLLAAGQDTQAQLLTAGFSEADLRTLSSPADRYSVAYISGNKYTLNHQGADLLYELQKQDEIKLNNSITTKAAIVAAIGSILSAILLGIQTLSNLLR